MALVPRALSATDYVAAMANIEPTVNTHLAACLRRRNPRWAIGDAIVSQSTRVLEQSARQPDVLIRGGGAPVVIETEFHPATSLDTDVSSRIGVAVPGETQVIESVIGVKYPIRLRDVSETALTDGLEEADDLHWYVSRQEPDGGSSRFPAAGWLVGDVNSIAGAAEALAISPSRLNAAAESMEMAVGAGAKLLVDRVGEPARAAMAQCLNQDDSEQTRRMASAIIANAFLFQIAVAHNHGTPNIDQTRAQHPEWVLGKRHVLEAWRQILEVNYWPIFDIAHRLLLPIPDDVAEDYCEALAILAQDLAGIGAIEVQDLAGQMFGRLIADRKFLATFYTLPESATLLAELAVARLDGHVDWSDSDAVTALRVGDLACGTGALLSAAYRRISARARRHGLDDSALHGPMMEDALIGADVMPAAAHLTTTMLSATHPAVPFGQCEIYVVLYGQMPNAKEPLLGSLDLIESSNTRSLFGRASTRLSGQQQSVASGEGKLQLPVETLDVCIMNPPFTRPTNHEITDVPVPSFAGFETSEDEQRAMADRLKKIKDSMIETAGDGNAGLASYFIDLAHQKLKPGGVLALIVPAQIIVGASWSDARALLTKYYEDITVATLSELTEGQTARAFSADTDIAEAVIIATKRQSDNDTDEQAAYVAFRERPAEMLEAIQTAQQTDSAAGKLQAGDVARLSMGDTPIGWLTLGRFAKDMMGHPAGVVSVDLAVAAAGYALSEIRLPRIAPIPLPMCPMSQLGARGPVHRDITGKDKRSGKVRGPFDRDVLSDRSKYPSVNWPMLWAHKHTVETTMTVLPDSEGHVRGGMNDQAEKLWGLHINKDGNRIAGATRLHISTESRLNSQATPACMTPVEVIGGRAWPSFQPDGGLDWEQALCAWLNSSLGLIARWWVSSRQQGGRANLTVTTIGTIPVPDLRAMPTPTVDRLASAFENFVEIPMLPANEAYRDEARQALDEAVLCEALGLPPSVLAPLGTLRLQWCEEPSVHGGKATRP